jgi:hypothetical protein
MMARKQGRGYVLEQVLLVCMQGGGVNVWFLSLEIVWFKASQGIGLSCRFPRMMR